MDEHPDNEASDSPTPTGPPSGWYRHPILAAIEGPDVGGVHRFAGLHPCSAGALEQAYMPWADYLACEPWPTLGQAQHVCTLLAGQCTLTGYRVDERREDERVTITEVVWTSELDEPEALGLISRALKAAGTCTPASIHRCPEGRWHIWWND